MQVLSRGKTGGHDARMGGRASRHSKLMTSLTDGVLESLGLIPSLSLSASTTHLHPTHKHSLNPFGKQDIHAGRRNECRDSWDREPGIGPPSCSF